MSIKFTKMQGLGNDFVILDYEEFEKTDMKPDFLAKRLCDRNFGIGADGLIIVNPKSEKADISWIFYNSDGSIAQMCGNGMRCFARYVYDKEYVDKKEFSVETRAGIIVPKIISETEIRVNMGNPILSSEKIPCLAKENLNIPFKIEDKEFKLNVVSMGNPHCVIFVDDHGKTYAKEYGSIIENDGLFPEKTNVEFVKVLSRESVKIDVWERGCGITLACGTGACATTVAGVLNGYLDNIVSCHLPGGMLKIEWNGNPIDTAHDVYMSGSATYSFTGHFNI